MRPVPQRRRSGPQPQPGQPTTPALRIPPRPVHHIRDGMVWVGCGLLGSGVAPLLGYPGLSAAALAVGFGAGALSTAAGVLRRHRNELSDRVLEALSVGLGMRQLDRRVLRLSSWTRGWPGQPRRVLLRYAPGVPDWDPEWLAQIISVLDARLTGRYRAVAHDRSRCRLSLALITGAEPGPEPVPFAQVRAERAVKELIGATADLRSAEFNSDDRMTAFEVTHEVPAKLANIGYRNRIERAISTMMPGRWRALWDMENDWVRFEERPSLPRSVWIPRLSADDTNDFAVAVAIDEDGRQVVWRPAVVPHALLTGGTGTGKTSTARAILAQITARGWPVWVCDAKRVEFLDFRSWPNVQIVAGSVWQQIAVVQRTWELMEYRYQLIEDGLAQPSDFDPLVVFLDEYAEMRLNLLEFYRQIKVKGDPTQPPTLAQVPSLARKARTARIHLVLSTQRPDVELLGSGEMRDNLGFRVSMGRLSPKGAEMMWENQAIGVSLPRGCTGRAMATHNDGRIVEVQCYRFPDMHAAEGTEERALLDSLRPVEAQHPRLVIVPPEDRTFTGYADAEWALASDRPDLDPLNVDPDQAAAAKALGSTLASLGLGSGKDSVARDDGTPFVLRSVPSLEEEEYDGGGDEWNPFEGYAESESCGPDCVEVGDLLEVEPGVWGVVDEEPGEDLGDPGCIALSWRGDDDESGYLSVPMEELVVVRHPGEQELCLSGVSRKGSRR